MRPAPARFPIIRRPPLRLVVAGILAATCALVVAQATARAEATVADYGAHRTAWVVQTPVDAGDVLDGSVVQPEARPAAFVPEGAATEDPTGRRAAQRLDAGEVVVERRLADGDRLGVAALVPEGWRALAIPSFDATLPVEVGQRVDLLAAVDAERGPVGTVVAEDGLVVHVAEEGTVTVAVPSPDAPRVVAALAGSYVSLAVSG